MCDRQPRGATLLEVMVATGFFTGMLIIVVLIARTGRSAYEKTDVHADTFRAAVMATDQIRRVLNLAQIYKVEDAAGEETETGGVAVTFFPAKTEDGQVKLGRGGVVFDNRLARMKWNPAGRLELEDPDGHTRILARLGTEGSVRFDKPRVPCPPNDPSPEPVPSPRLDVLRVTVRAAIKDPYGRKIRESEHEVVTDVYLPNQP